MVDLCMTQILHMILQGRDIVQIRLHEHTDKWTTRFVDNYIFPSEFKIHSQFKNPEHIYAYNYVTCLYLLFHLSNNYMHVSQVPCNPYQPTYNRFVENWLPINIFQKVKPKMFWRNRTLGEIYQSVDIFGRGKRLLYIWGGGLICGES